MCPNGYYLEEDACLPWTLCPQGTFEFYPPSSLRDRVCSRIGEDGYSQVSVQGSLDVFSGTFAKQADFAQAFEQSLRTQLLNGAITRATLHPNNVITVHFVNKTLVSAFEKTVGTGIASFEWPSESGVRWPITFGDSSGPCTSNEQSVSGLFPCIDCPIGTVANVDNTLCSACPHGSYLQNGGCQEWSSCPGGEVEFYPPSPTRNRVCAEQGRNGASQVNFDADFDTTLPTRLERESFAEAFEQSIPTIQNLSSAPVRVLLYSGSIVATVQFADGDDVALFEQAVENQRADFEWPEGSGTVWQPMFINGTGPCRGNEISPSGLAPCTLCEEGSEANSDNTVCLPPTCKDVCHR